MNNNILPLTQIHKYMKAIQKIVEEDLKEGVDKEAVDDLLAQHAIKEGWLKE